MSSILNDSVHDIMKSLADQQERILMDQLNDLVSRNLLVIESEAPILIRDMNSDQISVSRSVKLTLKDKEYIEKLELENRELKTKLSKLKDIYDHVDHVRCEYE